jgi:hypothetical protein
MKRDEVIAIPGSKQTWEQWMGGNLNEELGITPETVKSHARHIFIKLGAQTRMEAVSKAVTLGLI